MVFFIEECKNPFIFYLKKGPNNQHSAGIIPPSFFPHLFQRSSQHQGPGAYNEPGAEDGGSIGDSDSQSTRASHLRSTVSNEGEVASWFSQDQVILPNPIVGVPTSLNLHIPLDDL